MLPRPLLILSLCVHARGPLSNRAGNPTVYSGRKAILTNSPASLDGRKAWHPDDTGYGLLVARVKIAVTIYFIRRKLFAKTGVNRGPGRAQEYPNLLDGRKFPSGIPPGVTIFLTLHPPIHARLALHQAKVNHASAQAGCV